MLISLSAIRISDYKNWGAKFDKNLYRDIFQRYTKKKNAYRIYLPVGDKYVEDRVRPLPEVAKALRAKGYVIEDYVTGVAVKAEGTKKNPVRIGKILKDSPDVLKKYAEHKAKLGSKNSSDLVVVISRHPYDIMGMSTDRAWVSCTNLGLQGVQYKEDNDRQTNRSNPGINAKWVISDVGAGNIIAYLVNKSDLNIRRPIARVRILRYVNEVTKDFFLKPHDVVYGTDSPSFVKTVEHWLDEVNEVKAEGYYCATDNFDSRNDDDKVYVVSSEAQILQIIEDVALKGKSWRTVLDKLSSALQAPFNAKYLTKTVGVRILDLYQERGAFYYPFKLFLLNTRINQSEVLDMLNKIVEAYKNSEDGEIDDESFNDILIALVKNRNVTDKTVVSAIANLSTNKDLPEFYVELMKEVLIHPACDTEIANVLKDNMRTAADHFVFAMFLESGLLEEKGITDLYHSLLGYAKERVLANSKVPDSILTSVFETKNKELMAAALQNQNLPRDYLRTYGLQSQDPSLKLASLENPSLIADDLEIVLKEAPAKIKIEVAGHKALSQAQAMGLLHDVGVKIRAAVAYNKAVMTPDLLAVALDDKSPIVRESAASCFPKLSIDNFKKALNDSAVQVRNAAVESLLRSGKLSEEMMLYILDSVPHSNVRRVFKKLLLDLDRELPDTVVDRLVRDPDPSLRAAVVQESSLTPEQLAAFLDEKDVDVVDSLVSVHLEDMPEEQQLKYVKFDLQHIRMGLAQSRYPKVLDALAAGNLQEYVKRALLKNPKLKPALAKKFVLEEEDSDARVRFFASPSLPPAFLKEQAEHYASLVQSSVLYTTDSYAYGSNDVDDYDEYEEENTPREAVRDLDSLYNLQAILEHRKLANGDVARNILASTKSPSVAIVAFTALMVHARVNRASPALSVLASNKAIDINAPDFIDEVGTVLFRLRNKASVVQKLPVENCIAFLKAHSMDYAASILACFKPYGKHLDALLGAFTTGDQFMSMGDEAQSQLIGVLSQHPKLDADNLKIILGVVLSKASQDSLEDFERQVLRSPTPIRARRRYANAIALAQYYLANTPKHATKYNAIFAAYHGLIAVPDNIKNAIYSEVQPKPAKMLKSKTKKDKIRLQRRRMQESLVKRQRRGD